MSVSLHVTGYSGKDSPEFQKHLKAVRFCIENELSFPKETEEFFKGKVDGEYDLDDIEPSELLGCIENGVVVDLFETKALDWEDGGYSCRIKVSEIPPHVDTIVVSLS